MWCARVGGSHRACSRPLSRGDVRRGVSEGRNFEWLSHGGMRWAGVVMVVALGSIHGLPVADRWAWEHRLSQRESDYPKQW
eukprot:4472607-Prymnesium_polylepis.1